MGDPEVLTWLPVRFTFVLDRLLDFNSLLLQEIFPCFTNQRGPPLQGPEADYVAIIYELFESPKREKVFHARWFWRVEDTVRNSSNTI